jgi:predicted 2-oxoglutarate/Fe(II)-dependent dioxygenase YbiX
VKPCTLSPRTVSHCRVFQIPASPPGDVAKRRRDASRYPSNALHRVNPVERGTRLVAVGWAQSLLRRPDRRELLFDLDTARRSLFAREGKTAEFDLLSKCLSNLLRDWAEP